MPTMTRNRSGRVPPQRDDAESQADPKAATRPSRPYELDTSLRLATPEERAAKGSQLRIDLPRSSHADFEPPTARPDPVNLLAAQSATPLPHPLPIPDSPPPDSACPL